MNGTIPFKIFWNNSQVNNSNTEDYTLSHFKQWRKLNNSYELCNKIFYNYVLYNSLKRMYQNRTKWIIFTIDQSHYFNLSTSTYVCIYLYSYLCIYVSTYLRIYVSVCQCIIESMYLCMSISIHLRIYVSICQCITESMYLCISISYIIYLYIYVSTYLCILIILVTEWLNVIFAFETMDWVNILYIYCGSIVIDNNKQQLNIFVQLSRSGFSRLTNYLITCYQW